MPPKGECGLIALATVWRDTHATAWLRRSIRLIASALPTDSFGDSSYPCRAYASSITVLVPDPGSRITSSAWPTSAALTRRLGVSGWPEPHCDLMLARELKRKRQWDQEDNSSAHRHGEPVGRELTDDFGVAGHMPERFQV
jgi:hypothetical protein